MLGMGLATIVVLVVIAALPVAALVVFVPRLVKSAGQAGQNANADPGMPADATVTGVLSAPDEGAAMLSVRVTPADDPGSFDATLPLPDITPFGVSLEEYRAVGAWVPVRILPAAAGGAPPVVLDFERALEFDLLHRPVGLRTSPPASGGRAGGRGRRRADGRNRAAGRGRAGRGSAARRGEFDTTTQVPSARDEPKSGPITFY